ncbi:MAG: ATP-binding protein [Burkholderiales bacterium]|nr:ATP-binding protein [Burkholderiales bacterium]
MEERIPIEDLLYDEECSYLDFKSEQYVFINGNEHQKSELLKDILAFANTWRQVHAFILIGVKEIKGGRSIPIGIDTDLDDASLQQFVNSKTNRAINFSYFALMIDEVKIGVIRIPVQERPFFINKDYGCLKKNTVYIRRGSSTAEMLPDEIYDMGRSSIRDVQLLPDLKIYFADLQSRRFLGTELVFNLTLLDIPSKSEIPDFDDDDKYENLANAFLRNSYVPRIHDNRANRDYYRELIKYYYRIKNSKRLYFALRNDSNKSINDVRVQMKVNKNSNFFYFLEESQLPSCPTKYKPYLLSPPSFADHLSKQQIRSFIEIHDLGDTYQIDIAFDKIQPKQDAFCKDVIFLCATQTVSFELDVSIYGDDIPSPVTKKLSVWSYVRKELGSLEAIEKMHHKKMVEQYMNESYE